MFVIKKQTLYNCIFAIALTLSCAFNFLPSIETKETVGPVTLNKTIIVDAGHGYPDGGASGDNGSLEQDLNLKVSKFLGSYLQKSGATVIYTREDENSIVDMEGKKIRQIKVDDLNARKTLMDESGADLFVSIHMNKFTDKKYSGAQTFYSSNSPKSRKLAEFIQKAIKDTVDPKNDREIKVAGENIFLLKNSKIPSVLVECGFLSNNVEEAKLMTEKYQDKVAFAIFSGIFNYFSNNK